MDTFDGKLPRPYTVNTFHKKITQFNEMIREITLQDMEATPEERRQIIADTLRFTDFCASLRDLFGEDIQSKDMKGVYRKISTNPDAYVDWCELFGYQHSGFADEDSLPTVRNEGNVFAINFRTRAGNVSADKRRGDTTRSISYSKHLENYIITSKKGIVTLWNMKFENVYTVEIPDSAWLVECIYLPNLRKLLCVTERSLLLWDQRTKLKTTEFYIIRSFENAFVCVAYIPTSDTNSERILLGDDQGYVTQITITASDLNPKLASNTKRLAESNRLLMTLSYKKLHVPIKRRKLHNDWVLKLQWIDELECIASCSATDKNSFLMDELANIFNHDMVLKGADIYKGVNAFVYSPRANVIATAGSDKIIRLWHPNILSRPTGKLIGHLFTIVAISINEKDQHIISLSSARVIRVWCMNTMASLQIFTDNDDRPGEKRIYSLFYDQKYERLLTGSGVIDCWSLSRTVIDSLVVPQTHERCIVKLLYNGAQNQFLSICSEPIIKVWDGEKGTLAYQLAAPHGSGVEIKCICLSTTGWRLATGGADGSIKIWDVGAGQELKCYIEKLPAAVRDTEKVGPVVALQFLPHSPDKQRLLVAAGWKNEIRLFSDGDHDSDITYLQSFDDSHYVFSSSRSSALMSSLSSHRKIPPIGIILTTGAKGRAQRLLETEQVNCWCLYQCDDSTTLLVGSMSGAIIMWDTDTLSVKNILRLPGKSESIHCEIINSLTKKRVNAVGVLRHSVVRETIQNNTTGNSDERNSSEESSQSSSPYSDEGSERSDSPLGEATARDIDITVEDERSEQEDTTPHHDLQEIIEYPPVVISVHEDAGIRFWSMTGILLHETVAMTRRTGVPVTCYAADKRCNVLVTGDRLGYLTLWELSGFLQENRDSIKQIISWRAHTSKVTSLVIPNTQKLTIYSASADGSVRIWFDKTGKYLGYLGQGRPIVIPSSISTNTLSSSYLPCDITEKPLEATKPAKQDKNHSEDKDVPLVLSSDRWSPFRRSAYIRSIGVQKEPEDKKFFRSLTKPKQYNSHLEPLSEIGNVKSSLDSGFVFRSLPVYRVLTPELIKHPHTTSKSTDYALTIAAREGKMSLIPKNRLKAGKRPP